MTSTMLPRNIQVQAEAADAAIAALNQPEQEGNPAPAAPDEPTATEPTQPVAATVPQEPAPQATEIRDAAYWQHRFSVLKGKYDAEVPPLQRQVSELTRQLQEAKQELPAASAPQRAQDAIADLSKEELEQFGPELIAVIQRIASKAAGPASTVGAAEVETLRQEVGQLRDERQQDATARFWTDLEQAVPNFRQINDDQQFHAWLGEIDPFSGVPRQQLLINAQKELSAYRVAALFNAYTQATFAAAKPPGTQPPPIPPEQVQPAASRVGAETLQPATQQRMWSSADISQFYKDKAAGKYLPADAAALETDIFAAQSQGRITQ
ncbi:hypothetical protein WG219_10005 [Ectopseudomonas mendocina]|uniref:Uncharacterized protein n=1 Tax=Ectopseudomonas mendocina TaxID=300 RepID=A0ABZ2RTZ5_ECTME